MRNTVHWTISPCKYRNSSCDQTPGRQHRQIKLFHFRPPGLLSLSVAHRFGMLEPLLHLSEVYNDEAPTCSPKQTLKRGDLPGMHHSCHKTVGGKEFEARSFEHLMVTWADGTDLRCTSWRLSNRPWLSRRGGGSWGEDSHLESLLIVML